MQFHSRQLLNGRWGIYAEHRLLATVACSRTCRKILAALKRRQLEQSLAELPLTHRQEEGLAELRELAIASL